MTKQSRNVRSGVAKCLIAVLAWISPASVLAQTYPAKPVRVVVPFAPGGGSDITARVMSQKLAEHFGQSFVPDNRPGAGGLVGAEVAVKSPPDGYTIMISTSSWVTAAAIHKPAFDPISNLAPIAEIGFNPLVVSVHPSLPCRTTKELIALARSKPGELAVATPGVGSITHLATELFLSMAKLKVVTVPYKSTGATMSDVLTGRTQFIIGGLVPLQPYLQPGKLRAIAVTTAKRWPTLPDIPTVGETLPGYEVESWYGAVAPRGTPASVVDRLNSAINTILQHPDMKKSFESQGMMPTGGTPEQLNRRVHTDYDRWVAVVKEAGIKPE